MTMEAAVARSQALAVARAEVAAELTQLRAERDWLAERLEELRPFDCPTSLGHLECATVTADGDVIGHCPVTATGSEARVRACWQRAAAKATKPEEATK